VDGEENKLEVEKPSDTEELGLDIKVSIRLVEFVDEVDVELKLYTLEPVALDRTGSECRPRKGLVTPSE